MTNNRFLILTLAFVLIAGMSGTQAFAQTSGDAPNNPPGEANDINPPEVCDGSETDLLIQDGVPWSPAGNHDPRGAFVTELIAQEKDWCAIGSDAIGATDLSQFKVIIIPSEQPSSYYSNIMPGGAIHPDIDTWVTNGGVLSASLASFFSESWEPSTFVGGLTHSGQDSTLSSNDNSIADASHPLITGASPCPSGNCGAIVDVGANNDLDSWGFSNHGYFTSLPAGTNVILTTPDVTGDDIPEPVAIEYSHGSGVVVANLNTDAWRYNGQGGGQDLKYIANDIAYQNSLDTMVGGEFLPLDTTALLMAGMSANLSIIVPIAAGIAGVGAYYIRSRMNKE